MIVILAGPVTEDVITDSTQVHLGTPITYYIPYIEWVFTMVLIIIGIVFIFRIGRRVIKLLDIVILEKQKKQSTDKGEIGSK